MLKRVTLVLLIGLFIVTGFSGCRREPYGIEFKNEVLDFGTADEGTHVKVIFEFKNTGTEPLEILEIMPTCGCTTSDDWDKLVAPGRSGKIPITFNTQAYSGSVSKTVDIVTNVPGREIIQLTLQGEIFSPIAVQPRSIWVGEILDESQSAKGSFRLTNNKTSPIEPQDIIPEAGNVTFKLVTLTPSKEYRLDILVNPPFEVDEVIRRTIKIMTRSTAASYVELAYSYQVPPPVSISPKKVIVNMAQLKLEAMEQRINIKSYIDEPIDILDLQFDGVGMEPPWVDPLSKDKFYQIPLKFPQGFTFPEDKKSFTLSFRVKNDPRKQVYKIPVQEYEPAN